MIRWAKRGDEDALFNLWEVCFGESALYIDFFMKKSYTPENCLVYEEDSKPVAMLHLRTADFYFGKTFGAASYIYAAATLPENRGRGIMARLLSTAFNITSKSKCAFTFLLPASDSLYSYYGRLGYKSAFFIKKAALSRRMLEKFAAEKVKEEKADYSTIEKLRTGFFEPGVQWRKKELSYALDEWQFTGGEILCFDGGYILCKKQDDGVFVKETCGDFNCAAAALLNKFGEESFSFLLPPQKEYPFETRLLNYGMARISDDAPFSNFSEIKPYVNLLLD